MKKNPETTIDAIELLESQHRLIEELFAKYKAADRHERKQAAFERIADHLAAHATIEEKIFYPAPYARSTRDLLREAVEEHLSAKRVIADLLAMTPSEENYDAKVKVLEELIEHHVEEEEEELFIQARDELTSKELETLGASMSDLFESLMDGDPRFGVPTEIQEAAPVH